jgi:hypothetical protein
VTQYVCILRKCVSKSEASQSFSQAIYITRWNKILYNNMTENPSSRVYEELLFEQQDEHEQEQQTKN